ncbi:hypothetical protein [Bacillus sp. V5-8f]|uniref:hypothetical protein n=1 Tax=Bacillus sp. V5-8f TaxID=2053044 RepID=UPI000C7704DD|nr:hypothetical protein [Bacillus sp. V5-8f]PLT35302.1 hypothetical protein CUU64_03550 [Bacillus sp. V5-8f]
MRDEKFPTIISHFKGQKIGLFINNGQFVEGILVDAKIDHLVVNLNSVVHYFALNQIQALSKNARYFKPKAEDIPHQNKTLFTDVLTGLRYHWVTINSLDNQMFTGLLSKITGDHVMLIKDGEQLYIQRSFISNIIDGIYEPKKEQSHSKTTEQPHDSLEKSHDLQEQPDRLEDNEVSLQETRDNHRIAEFEKNEASSNFETTDFPLQDEQPHNSLEESHDVQEQPDRLEDNEVSLQETRDNHRIAEFEKNEASSNFETTDFPLQDEQPHNSLEESHDVQEQPGRLEDNEVSLQETRDNHRIAKFEKNDAEASNKFETTDLPLLNEQPHDSLEESHDLQEQPDRLEDNEVSLQETRDNHRIAEFEKNEASSNFETTDFPLQDEQPHNSLEESHDVQEQPDRLEDNEVSLQETRDNHYIVKIEKEKKKDFHKSWTSDFTFQDEQQQNSLEENINLEEYSFLSEDSGVTQSTTSQDYPLEDLDYEKTHALQSVDANPPLKTEGINDYPDQNLNSHEESSFKGLKSNIEQSIGWVTLDNDCLHRHTGDSSPVEKNCTDTFTNQNPPFKNECTTSKSAMNIQQDSEHKDSEPSCMHIEETKPSNEPFQEIDSAEKHFISDNRYIETFDQRTGYYRRQRKTSQPKMKSEVERFFREKDYPSLVTSITNRQVECARSQVYHHEQKIDTKEQKLLMEKQFFALMKHAEKMYHQLKNERLQGL